MDIKWLIPIALSVAAIVVSVLSVLTMLGVY